MRMYRLGWLFEQLEINLSINLLWTTLFRNVLVRAAALWGLGSGLAPYPVSALRSRSRVHMAKCHKHAQVH